MRQWINQFLENEIVNRTDKTIDGGLLSVLSVRPLRILDEKKVENNPETGTDETDKPTSERPLSVLSVRPSERLDEKMENKPEPDISDKPDRLDPNLDLSGSPQDVLERISYPYGEQDFEERLAITEYDGAQTVLHAHCIAYLDAFLSILFDISELDPQRDWLAQRVQAALNNLEAQHFPTQH